jgi:hypothetical protein
MNTEPTKNITKEEALHIQRKMHLQRWTDLFDLLKFQRLNYPEDLTWFQRALIHQEISSRIESANNIEIGEPSQPRYTLHKRLRLKVDRMIVEMKAQDNE